jgi:ApaG protein
VVTKTTSNIRISVETEFQRRWTGNDGAWYIFVYYITIRNENDEPVQLLRRHWRIYDALNQLEEFTGEGVIGQQPVIQPGEEYRYNSSCYLRSTTGHMSGWYEMEVLTDKSPLRVDIPKFELVAPFQLN